MVASLMHFVSSKLTKLLFLNFILQVSIGHSEVIQQVKFTPDSLGLISIGEGIFLWDFYGVNKDKETIR